MPIGEVIGELILRPILEIVICGIAYWTGYLVLKAISFGSIPLAPFTTMQEKNRSKRKWNQIDWSIWLHRPMKRRELKADVTILTGILFLVGIGFVCYFILC